MKATLFLIISLLSLTITSAQDLIAVQNGNNPSFYSDLSEAIEASVAGDTLYIPGRNYIINDTINKPIHLIGVGHDPNSTNATSKTVLTTSHWDIPQIVLDTGADNGSITGIYFTPTNTPYQRRNLTSLVEINNYLIDRCLISVSLTISNSVIKESILGRCGITANNSSLITNNIFIDRSNGFVNCSVKNNIFLTSFQSYYAISAIDSLIENNIFPPNYVFSSPNNCNIRNNVNTSNGVSGTNIKSGNFDDSADLTTVFTNYTQLGDALNYTADFHLPNASPYENAGTDGRDIGIYGGRFPWKDGSIPFNPHIVSKIISGTTDENGNLPVNIEVQAQEN